MGFCCWDGRSVSQCSYGCSTLLAVVIFCVVSGIVFLFKLYRSFDTANVFSDSGPVPPALPTSPTEFPESGSTYSVPPSVSANRNSSADMRTRSG
jgi:hypothetical protein